MSAGKGQRDLKKELRNRNVQLSTTEAGKKKRITLKDWKILAACFVRDLLDLLPLQNE